MFNVLLPLTVAAFILADVALLIFVLTRYGDRRPPEMRPAKKPTRPTRWWGWLVLGLFILVWSAATVYLDFVGVQGAVRQYRSLGYQAIEGEVVKCAMIEKPSGHGYTYTVDIEYVYHVMNQEHRGKRVRHYNLWDRGWVSQFVKEHPPGTAITVYYDPTNPAEAVLIREFDGGLLFWAMFLIPFNMAMVGMLALAIYLRRGETLGRSAFAVSEINETIRISLSPTNPTLAGLLAFFVAAFIVTLFVALCLGMPPSITTMVIAWGTVLGLSGLAYLRVARLTATGRYDLVLDPLKKTITLPDLNLWTNPVVVPLADVVSVEVVPVDHKDNLIRYIPTVRWHTKDGELHESKLVEWFKEEDAELLAKWLRGKVGISTVGQAF